MSHILKSLRESSVLERNGLSRDVSSLRDSPDKPSPTRH